MKYLAGEAQANISILFTAMRWLRRFGPATYAELAEQLRPESLTPGADNALRSTLSVGSHIGLVQQHGDDEIWQLSIDLGDAAALDRHDHFRDLVRRALLDQAVSDASSGSEASDVSIGLAWLCSLDPTRPLAWGWDDGPEDQLRAIGSEWIVNGTQWRAFRRWAIALGFAVEGKGATERARRLIPDPTAAIARCLPAASDEIIPARQFAEHLSERLPVIDGGSLERAARDAGVRYDTRGDATLGPVVGHSLERLHYRGWIRLRKRDDAAGRLSYLVDNEARTFDEVEIVGAR